MQSVHDITLVRCPHCEATHNFKKDEIGTQPRRVLCTECGKNLIVARRDSVPPEGLKTFEFQEFAPESLERRSEFARAMP